MADENSKPKVSLHTILLLVIIGVLIIMYFLPRNQVNNIENALNQLDSARYQLEGAKQSVDQTQAMVDSLKLVFLNYQQFVVTMDQKVKAVNAAHDKNNQDFHDLLTKSKADYKNNRIKVLNNLYDSLKVFNVDTIP